MERSDVARIIVPCTDLNITILSPDLYELRTGKKVFKLQSSEADRNTFLHVIATVLPKLNGSAPLHTALSSQELLALEPFLEQLLKMELLFVVQPSVAPFMQTQADRGLYTYLARRTPDPAPLFLQIKHSPIMVYGPASLVSGWLELLHAQGLAAIAAHARSREDLLHTSQDAALTIIIASEDDPSSLPVINIWCCEHHMRWVPVVVGKKKVQLGPWIDSQGTPCYACLMSNQAEQTVESTAFKECAIITSWSSMQPGAVAWVGSMLAQMATRALIPLNDESPWGQVTVFDTSSLLHETRRVWKYPYCSVCGRHQPKTQQWVEA